MTTSRELVRQALTFKTPARIPRQMWILPWAETRFPAEVAEIRRRYPSDITGAPGVYRPSPVTRGNPYRLGEYVDEWGCLFDNLQEGVIGEVKQPILDDLDRVRSFKPPFALLPGADVAERDRVNRYCAETTLFVTTGCCPRPWERYQFLRGTENSLMDMGDPVPEVRLLLNAIHDFYMRELEFWVTTDVDAITFMDDWGSQRQLLIPPVRWREWFKPLYKDYCDLAKAHNKFVFMHSDGCISEIMEDLVEVGVDAVNSQLFTMDMADLAARVKGRITFWGEIDRQHVLTDPDPETARKAVRQVARHLHSPAGGIIAQLEFGPGAHPRSVSACFEEWDRIGGGQVS